MIPWCFMYGTSSILKEAKEINSKPAGKATVSLFIVASSEGKMIFCCFVAGYFSFPIS